MKLTKKLAFGSLATALSAVLSLHLLFYAALEAAPPEYSPPTEHVEQYFAYGSNMSPQYLARIRGLHSQWSGRNHSLPSDLPRQPGLGVERLSHGLCREHTERIVEVCGYVSEMRRYVHGYAPR